jgi:hypothetical protein
MTRLPACDLRHSAFGRAIRDPAASRRPQAGTPGNNYLAAFFFGVAAFFAEPHLDPHLAMESSSGE